MFENKDGRTSPSERSAKLTSVVLIKKGLLAHCLPLPPSVVSERTPIEFYLIPKYHPVFDKGLRRGKKIDFSQTKFEVV